MFDISVYRQRRAALCAALRQAGMDSGCILLPGNAESPMNYPDNCYRFRQDSAFLYLFGLAEPGLAAMIDIATGWSVLFADETTIDMLVWTGPRPRVADWGAACGADGVKPCSELAASLQQQSGDFPLFLPPYRAETVLQLASLLGLAPDQVRTRASIELVRAMILIRETKSEAEIAEIERAVDISIAMHKAVMAAVRPGASEAELMALAWKVALSGGGMPSFPPIATTRGAVLHNHAYDQVCQDGGLFLLDCGAETSGGYAGDLTSTFPISGRYSDRQKAIYSIVLEAGRFATSQLRPGVPFRSVHLGAARVITRGLCDLGLMRGDVDEAVAAGAHALFFPHGLGHQMGLDVHDMESLGELEVGYGGEPRSTQFGLKSLRLAKPLRAGMVLTIEPGIYFIEGLYKLWRSENRHAEFIHYDRLEAWQGFGGIRNEEDWLVTADGARRLGSPFDKSVAAMEAYLSV